jgi:hypothetical protein
MVISLSVGKLEETGRETELPAPQSGTGSSRISKSAGMILRKHSGLHRGD